MRDVCGVVCAVLRARERPTERARAVARAGEYKCDYLAVREVRGCFNEKSSCESTLSFATHAHELIYPPHVITRDATSPSSLFIHRPSLSSPAPRNTSDPLNALTHTLHTLPHSSITLHPSPPLPLLSSHHIDHLEAGVLLNKGIILEDAALELRQL